MENKSTLINLYSNPISETDFEIRLSQPIRGRFSLVILEVASGLRKSVVSVCLDREGKECGKRDIYTGFPSVSKI